MVNVSVARRYARALLQVSAESGSTDQVLESLEAFGRLLEQNAELKAVVESPTFPRPQLWAVLEKVLGLLGATNTGLQNFFRLLVDRNRLGALPDILRLFRDMADQKAGRLRGKITSARPLTPEALQRLETSLERLTQRNVVLETKVDPALLGGVSAQVGPVMYDGSLRSQLQDLRESLKRQ